MLKGSVLLVFLDGVGIDAAGEHNPFSHARLPVLTELLGSTGPLFAARPTASAAATLTPLDATLGVPGMPQSGTGQAALLCGFNAASLHGRHHGPWVPTALRSRVEQESLLRVIQATGAPVAFANAYPMLQMSARRTPPFLRAGAPLAALGAGVLTRHAEALQTGDAVASEIVNDGWREKLGHTELPIITPVVAGANLAAIAAANAFTLFAHYSTDTAGHEQDLSSAVAALERVDEFIGGILAHLPADTLLVIASDHGNIEDIRTGHTRNPALGMFIGRGHEEAARGVASLLDVAPRIIARVV